MRHSYSALYIHVVFATYERRPSIPPNKLDELPLYLQGLAQNLGFQLLSANGMLDHIHLLVAIPTNARLSEIVQKIKANSSRWIGRSFRWQEGYSALSVSPSQVAVVRRYIAGQREHHKKRNYEAEFRSLLLKCGVKLEDAVR